LGSITDFLEDELLDHVFNGNAFTPAATLYLCLCTADPTDAATGASMNECANSGNYQRTAISFAAASSRRVTQNGGVTFPTATGSWGTVSHWAIASTQTYGSGNVYAHGTLAFSRSVATGNTPTIADGEVYVEFTAGDTSSYLAHALLDLAFRNQAYSVPNTWVAICLAEVQDTDSGSLITEPSGGAYERVRIYTSGCGAPYVRWSAVTSGRVENDAAVVFPTATTDWGTITSVAVVDDDYAGEILAYDNDMTDQDVYSTETPQFNYAELDVTLD